MDAFTWAGHAGRRTMLSKGQEGEGLPTSGSCSMWSPSPGGQGFDDVQMPCPLRTVFTLSGPVPSQAAPSARIFE